VKSQIFKTDFGIRRNVPYIFSVDNKDLFLWKTLILSTREELYTNHI